MPLVSWTNDKKKGKKRLSLRATGEALGLTKGQAHVLEANSLSKLRENTYAPKLRCLL
jgi:hypothetical protein